MLVLKINKNNFLSIIVISLQYKITQKLEGHAGPITALEAAYVPSTEELKQGAQLSAVIVTASVDSSVKIWRRTNEEGTFSVLQYNILSFRLENSYVDIKT